MLMMRSNVWSSVQSLAGGKLSGTYAGQGPITLISMLKDVPE